MSAQIISFPGFEPKPAKSKKAPKVRLSKALKESIKKEPDPAEVELLQAARAAWSKMQDEQATKEERLFLAWQAGKRVAPVRYMSLAECGISKDTFGEGTALFRWAVEATPRTKVIPKGDKDEALSLAIRTLNTLGLVARYGMLSGSNRNYRDDDGKEDAEDFEATAIAELGSALKRLQHFGGRAEQSPAERKRDQGRYLKEKARRDAFRRACDEARQGP